MNGAHHTLKCHSGQNCITCKRPVWGVRFAMLGSMKSLCQGCEAEDTSSRVPQVLVEHPLTRLAEQCLSQQADPQRIFTHNDTPVTCTICGEQISISASYYTCGNCFSEDRDIRCRCCAMQHSRSVHAPRCTKSKFCAGHLMLKVPTRFVVHGDILPCVLYGNSGELKQRLKSLGKKPIKTAAMDKYAYQTAAPSPKPVPTLQLGSSIHVALTEKCHVKLQYCMTKPAAPTLAPPPLTNTTCADDGSILSASSSTRWGAPLVTRQGGCCPPLHNIQASMAVYRHISAALGSSGPSKRTSPPSSL